MTALWSVLHPLTNGVTSLLASAPALPPVDTHPVTGASTFSNDVDWVFWFVTWVGIFFFVLITVVMVYFMVKYRRTEHVAKTEGPTHNTPLEITWSLIPLIIVIGMFYVGMKSYVKLTTPPQDAYTVYVTAQKWQWQFDYPNGASTTNHLILPIDTPVKLIMQSSDVLHSLYVPAFRTKMDVVPGRYTKLWFEPTQTGVFDLFCAEYCGTNHWNMKGVVEVLDEAEFQIRITEEANWIKAVPDEELWKAGLRLFPRCSSCHTLDGTRLTGPSWRETHELWGQQRALEGGGSILVDEEYIRSSIVNPQAHVSAGYPPSMPTFQGLLKPREITALVEMIKNLDRINPDGSIK